METGTKKKNIKKNSFSNFMFKYKTNEEAKGRNIDMATATLEAGKIWQVT